MKAYLGLILLLGTQAYAQNTNLDYRGALKISNQTSFERFSKTNMDPDTNINLVSSSALQILHPTIAYQWKTKSQNFHELEITNFNFKKSTIQTEVAADSIPPGGPGYTGIPVSGGKTIDAFVSLKYEYIMTFRKLKEKKLVPSFGFAANPYFKQTNYTSILSSQYPTKEQFFGARFFVTPRLTYFISPKLFIDVNLPICVMSTYFLTDRYEDPVVPINERRTNTFSFETFPAVFNARVGIGIKI